MPSFKCLAIPEIIEIVPDRYGDKRGFFSEVYRKSVWVAGGVDVSFVQDNHSFSRDIGVLRGLHFQTPPFAQAKLVRVTRGAVFDVAVDIRVGSPTFAQWVGIELTADKGNQLFVPAGFAHGFVTLMPNTEFLYKASNPYSKDNDRSIKFNDPAVGIKWPSIEGGFLLSDKDENAPLLTDIETSFVYEGNVI